MQVRFNALDFRSPCNEFLRNMVPNISDSPPTHPPHRGSPVVLLSQNTYLIMSPRRVCGKKKRIKVGRDFVWGISHACHLSIVIFSIWAQPSWRVLTGGIGIFEELRENGAGDQLLSRHRSEIPRAPDRPSGWAIQRLRVQNWSPRIFELDSSQCFVGRDRYQNVVSWTFSVEARKQYSGEKYLENSVFAYFIVSGFQVACLRLCLSYPSFKIKMW